METSYHVTWQGLRRTKSPPTAVQTVVFPTASNSVHTHTAMPSNLGKTSAVSPLAYPSDATLSEILLDYNLNNTPDDKPAIIDGVSGRVEYTYGSLRQGVRVLAAYFANDLHFESGDVVAVLSFTKVCLSTLLSELC